MNTSRAIILDKRTLSVRKLAIALSRQQATANKRFKMLAHCSGAAVQYDPYNSANTFSRN